MEAAIQTMVKVFLKSTKGKESLGQKEFQGLVKSQLSNILSDTDSKEAIKNMGQGLDADHDGKVGFEEYMKLVGYLAVSLSEQRTVATEEPAQNAASGQVAESVPDKEEEKPEANAEVKEEAKPEANETAKAEPATEAKVDANADATVQVKVEVKAEGETEPVAVEEVEIPAATAVAAVVEAVEEVVKEEGKAEETEKVEEPAEKLPAAADEEAEKKTEEATS
ncbi:S100 calcium binding protein U [Pempheris klunzingeri]|uniref:S100 calcium binding protein U n=1 Tax=Pempheris klunzingeri TaxID=3127111 RepID=UPI00398186F0